MSDLVANILTDVNNVNTLTDYTLADSGKATAAVQNNNSALDASYAASAARAKAVADATEVVKQTQTAGQLVAQTAVQSYAHALGVDADGTLSAQQRAAQEIFLDASARAAAAAKNVADKRSVSFVSDPLQWLSNKLTINDDINEYNGAAGEANTAESFIQESNQLIDARAVALKNIETNTSQASAQAQVKIATAAALEQSDAITRAGIAANTQGVEAVQNMSMRQIQIANVRLDSDSKLLQVQNDQKRLQLAVESHNLEAARFEYSKAEKEEKDGADKYMSSQLRKGLQLMYPNNPSAWDIPDGKYKAMISGKTPLDPVWAKAFNVAQASDIAGSNGSRVLGTSPSDALSVLQFKPTIAPSAQPTVDLLTRTAAAAMKLPAYQQAIASKDVKGAQDIINNAVDAAVKADSTHVDSPSSLYYLPPVNKLVELSPGLSGLPVNSVVIAPAAAAGVDMSNPTQVANFALQAVKDGKISLNDAANGLSDIYKQGQRLNFESKQIFSLGIAAAPNYITPVSGMQLSGNIGSLGQVDWTDPIQVKEVLMRKSAINQQLTTTPMLSARVR